MRATTVLIAAAAGFANAKTIAIEAGNGGLVFKPDDIKADIGDILEFQFLPANHSVAQASFASPCQPLAQNGFYSGYFPVSSGKAVCHHPSSPKHSNALYKDTDTSLIGPSIPSASQRHQSHLLLLHPTKPQALQQRNGRHRERRRGHIGRSIQAGRRLILRGPRHPCQCLRRRSGDGELRLWGQQYLLDYRFGHIHTKRISRRLDYIHIQHVESRLGHDHDDWFIIGPVGSNDDFVLESRCRDDGGCYAWCCGRIGACRAGVGLIGRNVESETR